MSRFYGPQPLPIRKEKQIEVTGENIKRRVIALIIVVLVAIGSIWYGIHAALSKDPGWTRITALQGYPAGASGDLDFEYCLGEDATDESKALTNLFSQATYRSYQIYHPTQAFAEIGNLKAVNAAPNQEVSVEPELYRAFTLFQEKGSRMLFLAPVYSQYDGVFRSMEDSEAMLYDPYYNEEAAGFVAEAMAFVRDPEAISLSLLGNNKVRLNVREDYLKFAEETGMEAFVDFYWLRNALIVDDLALVLQERGYTQGYIACREGFCRYLNDPKLRYTVELLDFKPTGAMRPAKLQLKGGVSLACLHTYGASDLRGDFYYQYADGLQRTPYLDAETGECRGAIQDLTLLSATASCTELGISALPAFTAKSWDSENVLALAQEQIGAVWCEGTSVCHTELAGELSVTDETYQERTLP